MAWFYRKEIHQWRYFVDLKYAQPRFCEKQYKSQKPIRLIRGLRNNHHPPRISLNYLSDEKIWFVVYVMSYKNDMFDPLRIPWQARSTVTQAYSISYMFDLFTHIIIRASISQQTRSHSIATSSRWLSFLQSSALSLKPASTLSHWTTLCLLRYWCNENEAWDIEALDNILLTTKCCYVV